MILKGLYEILDARRQKTSLEDDGMKEYVLVNLCLVISKSEIDKLLKISKSRFRSKTRVNKIMFRKKYEVTKEIEEILKQILMENQYEINLVKDDTHLEVHT